MASYGDIHFLRLPATECEPISSMLALLTGLTRAFLPFFVHQRHLTIAKDSPFLPYWFPIAGHLVQQIGIIAGQFAVANGLLNNHQSAVAGAYSCRNSNCANIVLRQMEFLSNLCKTICLALLAAGIACQFPPFSLLPFIFGISFSDGLIQRLTLKWAFIRGEKTFVCKFLLHLSFGPLLSALLLTSDYSFSTSNVPDQFLLRQMPIQFSTSPTLIFGGLALFQASLLLPMWPQKCIVEEEEEDGCQNIEIAKKEESRQTKRNKSSAGRKRELGWSMWLPLCFLASLSSALFLNFPYVLFACFQRGEEGNQFEAHKNLLTLFTAFAVFTRFLLALIASASGDKRNQLASLLGLLHSPNVLFPISLFVAGLSLCMVNMQMLRPFAVSLLGVSLSPLWPAALCYSQHPFSGAIHLNHRHLSHLLFAYQIGGALFPLLFTQIVDVYGGPQQLFSSLGLLFVLLMVISFVCLLNAQAECRSGKKGQLWAWFRGEGAAGARTRRSFRRFVRNVRGSLRKRSLIGRQQRKRVATGERALLEDSNMFARSNYHSIQQELCKRASVLCEVHHHCPIANCTDANSSQNQQQCILRRKSEEPKMMGKMRTKEGSQMLWMERRKENSLPTIVLHQGTPSPAGTASARSSVSLSAGQNHLLPFSSSSRLTRICSKAAINII